MSKKFKNGDYVVDKAGNKGKIIYTKWACCNNIKYMVHLSNGNIIEYYENEIQRMVETK